MKRLGAIVLLLLPAVAFCAAPKVTELTPTFNGDGTVTITGHVQSDHPTETWVTLQGLPGNPSGIAIQASADGTFTYTITLPAGAGSATSSASAYDDGTGQEGPTVYWTMDWM